MQSQLLRANPDTTPFHANEVRPTNWENDQNQLNVQPKPQFSLNLNKVEKASQEISETETPRVATKKVKHMIITQNEEAVIRHDFAQSLVELINKNERSLQQTQNFLNQFICEGRINRSTDTQIFIKKFREQWAERMQNMSAIFDKICLVNKEGECDDRV